MLLSSFPLEASPLTMEFQWCSRRPSVTQEDGFEEEGNEGRVSTPTVRIPQTPSLFEKATQTPRLRRDDFVEWSGTNTFVSLPSQNKIKKNKKLFWPQISGCLGSYSDRLSSGISPVVWLRVWWEESRSWCAFTDGGVLLLPNASIWLRWAYRHSIP